MKIQLMVMFGGKSVEHEISIISAVQAMKQLNTEKYDVIPLYITKENEMYTGDDLFVIESYKNITALKQKAIQVAFARENGKTYMVTKPLSRKLKVEKRIIDVAFPIVHGNNVEDGTLQGFIKTLGIPFVGCDVIASAAGMDKHFMKTILKDAGVPVLDCVVYTKFDYDQRRDEVVAEIMAKYDFPVIVKPATLGSSIGITKANDKQELIDALDVATSYATKILIERAVVELREINCSVIGDIESAEASECEEPLNASTILSFEDKYIGNATKNTDSNGMASLARQIPANLTPDQKQTIQEMAVKTFKALGCNGVVRIDFIIDKASNEIFVNEINTIPGSLSFYLWDPVGIQYKALLDRMIDLALKRDREEKSILSSFSSNVIEMCSSGALGGKKGKLKV